MTAIIQFALVPLLFIILLVIATRKVDKWRRKKEDERMKEIIKKAIEESKTNRDSHTEDKQ